MNYESKIMPDPKLDFANVLIRPQKSDLNSRSQVDLNVEYNFKYSTMKWNGIPIIAANMDCVGTFEIYESLSESNMITALHKFYTPQDYKKYNENKQLNPDLFMVSIGKSDDSISYLKAVQEAVDFKWICIDIANGYIASYPEYCKSIRDAFPDKIIVAGNVVTSEAVVDLVENGKVDVVKIGIGPGSACTTRIKTGVGMPQLSAIMECSFAADQLGAHIIGDGGITCPGDVSKAFGGGAHFVMMGGVFSGHDENPGDTIEIAGQKYKTFYGMSSSKAMNKYYGETAKYRTSEGRDFKVKYKGPVSNTILDYLGGLRSTCTYVNAKNIPELKEKVKFYQASHQFNASLI